MEGQLEEQCFVKGGRRGTTPQVCKDEIMHEYTSKESEKQGGSWVLFSLVQGSLSGCYYEVSWGTGQVKSICHTNPHLNLTPKTYVGKREPTP